MCISFLFSILGWKLSSEKLLEYDSVCKVLGVKPDLKMSGERLVVMSSTEERVQELQETLQAIHEAGVLSRKDGERSRDSLQFASGQMFGRVLRNMLKQLSEHAKSGCKTISPWTAKVLKCMSARLGHNRPREIRGSLSEHVPMYVDASFEPNGFCGVGGILFSEDGKAIGFSSEQVGPETMAAILQRGRETAIQELETLALLMGVHIWEACLNGRQVVAFTDSEAVRGAFLKSWSGNDSCSEVLHEIFRREENMQTQIWLERVPSQSNPADPMSREVVESFQGLQRTRCEVHHLWAVTSSHQGVTPQT
jgi:ribonuclease HI